MKYYNIHLINTKTDITVDENTTLSNISKLCQKDMRSKILSAKVDGNIKSLDYKITSDSNIEFFDITSNDGFRIYQRSTMFIMLAAVNEVMGPDTVVWAEHTINKNYFCCIYDKLITDKELSEIKNKMQELVDEAYRIDRLTVSVEDGIKIYKKFGLINRINAFKYLKKSEITLYKLNNFYDYLYGPIVPDTSYIKTFDIEKCENGFLLKFENPNKPGEINNSIQYPKLMQVFNEHNQWSRILNVDTVSSLNDSITKGTFKDNIWVAEALHEKKIAEIADMISKQKKPIVMIAGPSSSGKTTFSKRLSIQLRVMGIKPFVISLDDYYKNRSEIPLEPDGSQNFERLSTIDVERFNNDMLKLLKGETVETPLFDFFTGSRKAKTKSITLAPDNILIIEGIHGINEKLSYAIPTDKKFKIYISALTQLNLDEHNRISTADTRLIRRIVRDNHFRGFPARQTIEMWSKVIAGEEENIYPYQEQADIMFNSALIYEMCVLKSYAEPLLFEIERGEATYSEAKRLLNLLNCFLSVDPQYVPQNSLIREFVGGSCFC